MYSDLSITILAERIGFGVAYGDTVPTLDASLLTGPSGRVFSFFHKLVTIDNLYKCAPKVGMNSNEFEAFLESLRLNGAKSVLSRVLDQNQEYIPGDDYSAVIEARNALLDEAVGYAVAISCLELLLSTDRSNLESINASLTAAKIQLELYGYKTDKGVTVATGIDAKFYDAVKKATDAIFKTSVKVGNASDRW